MFYDICDDQQLALWQDACFGVEANYISSKQATWPLHSAIMQATFNSIVHLTSHSHQMLGPGQFFNMTVSKTFLKYSD